MVIVCGTESPKFRKQNSGPPEPTNDDCAVNALYEPSESKKLQMRNHEYVKKNVEDRRDEDCRSTFTIGDAYVKFKAEFNEMMLDFDLI